MQLVTDLCYNHTDTEWAIVFKTYWGHPVPEHI